MELAPLPGDVPTDCQLPEITYAEPNGAPVVADEKARSTVDCEFDDRFYQFMMDFQVEGYVGFMIEGSFSDDGMSSSDGVVDFDRIDYADFYRGGNCSVTFTEKRLERVVGYFSCPSIDEPSRLSKCSVPGAAEGLPKSFFRFENCQPRHAP